MPIAGTNFANTYVFGRGELFVDLFDNNGNKTGERFLGNCPGFSLNIESEQFEHFSSTGGLRKKDLTVTLSVNFNAEITCDDVSAQNLALFLGGTVSTVTQTATPVTNEAITVNQDREYQLGATSGNPMGVQDVTSVVVTNVAGTTTYVLNTDYRLDAAKARIYIIRGGAIANGTIVHVDYTPTAGTITRVSSGGSGSQTGAIRFISDNAAGPNRDLYIASASLSPSGELPLITEDELASFTLAVGINERDSGTPQIIIDGRRIGS
jgi:hypothetical protein